MARIGFLSPRFPSTFTRRTKDPRRKYEPIGRGSFDLKMLTDRLMENARVDLQEIDLRAPKWRNRRVLTLDERLVNLTMAKELKITADFAENFSPVRVSKSGESEFGIGMMTDKVVPGMLLKAADRAYALGYPGLKGFEERLQEAVEIESLIEEEENDDGYDEDEMTDRAMSSEGHSIEQAEALATTSSAY